METQPGRDRRRPVRTLATAASLAQEPAKDVGRWEPLMTWDTNPQFGLAVHLLLLKDGRVLALDKGRQFGTFNPQTGVFINYEHYAASGDFFCGGHAQLPDGRILFQGGGTGPEAFGCNETCSNQECTNCYGEMHPYAAVFDPQGVPIDGFPLSPTAWVNVDSLPDLAGTGVERRWYPVVTALANGKMLLTAGSWTYTDDQERDQYVPALYDPDAAAGSKWTRLEESTAFKVVHYYPFMQQLSDGTVFMSGGPYFDQTRDASIHLQTYALNVALDTWSPDPGQGWEAHAPGGSACMYALDKVIKGGGSEIFSKPSTVLTEFIDLAPGVTRQWVRLGDMQNARQFFYMMPLPDGRVLAIGGYDSTAPGPVRRPEWIALTAQQPSWSNLSDIDVNGTLAERRQYHSAGVLLPDGRILMSGGEGGYGESPNAQLFRPPYLYDNSSNFIDDVGGVRPVINMASTGNDMYYLNNFMVYLDSGDVSQITKVCLIRLGAATHSVDQNTRRVELSYVPQPAQGRLRVAAPAGPTMAPPGHYMLFVLKPGDRPNIEFPSKAKIVRLRLGTPIGL